MEIPKLTDKELLKWLNILGAEKILILHIDNKIHLSNKQLKTYIGIESRNKRNRRS